MIFEAFWRHLSDLGRHFGTNWAPRGSQNPSFWHQGASKVGKRRSRKASKKLYKNDAEKDEKMMPKGSQNDEKMTPKWIQNRSDFGTCDFSDFAKSISLKWFFPVNRGPGNDQKSFQNRCQNQIGKKDGKMTEKGAKMMPKGLSKSIRNRHFAIRDLLFAISGGFWRSPIFDEFSIGKRSTEN